ncbi:hypothetical protein [Lacihabitans soyangensis]|uniref:DUF4402 domain-containing protein n=1 Tax=Lacihabitans soyangensis TaxID=869394 RepID=A0AAE3H1F4_9BACT|nr:hypothetical protein [Lacihabitans soyangensis]MCP9762254.1 hypothetical protein [Lacihabitans soyangensis]
MKKLIFSFLIALAISKVSAQSILLTPGNQTTTNSNPDLILRSTGTPDVRSIRSAGTIASPTPPLTGVSLLRIRGAGFWNTTSFSDQVGIDMFTTENWNSSSQGADMRFSTTSNGTFNLIERMRISHDGKIGIGTTVPLSKLDVSGDISLSSPNLGFGSRKLQFYSDQGTGNEWRPGYIESADGAGGSSYTGRLDFYTNGTGVGNKLGSVLGMSVLNGKVGVGSSTANSPDFPLHVTSTAGSTSSTTGAFAIGSTTGQHLVFDTDEINSYSNTAASVLYLNPNSNGNVQIGSSAGDLLVTGYTKLGGFSAPNIKMKKLTGTTGAGASFTTPHGLNVNKILDVSIFIERSGGVFTDAPNQIGGAASIQYSYSLNATDITFFGVGSSLNNRPFRILITYEE